MNVESAISSAEEAMEIMVGSMKSRVKQTKDCKEKIPYEGRRKDEIDNEKD